MSTGCWKVVGHRAELLDVPGGWWLDLGRPREGLQSASGGSTLLRTHVPGLPDPVPGAMVADVYVREADLVVTYAPTPGSQLHTQIYWRRLLTPSAIGLHWVFSVWTPRLDARPMIGLSHQWLDRSPRLATALPEGEAGAGDLPGFRELRTETVMERPGGAASLSAPCLILERATAGRTANMALDTALDTASPMSMVSMAYPTDVVRCSVSAADATPRVVEYQLLDEHLEKGVIRRAQAMVWWVGRDGDASQAAELYRQFLAAPPPLTT